MQQKAAQIHKKMKTKIYILLALGIALASCTKEGAKAFKGYYSFKTGGSVDITGKLYDTKLDTVKIDTVVHIYTFFGIPIRDTSFTYQTKEDTIAVRDTIVPRRLVTESGQMHVLEKDDGSLVITMNITGGDPVVFKADASGNDLTLSPTRRFVPIHTEKAFSYYDLSVYGSGKRYDNMILIDLFYDGDYTDEGFEGTLSASRVNCIATENE